MHQLLNNYFGAFVVMGISLLFTMYFIIKGYNIKAKIRKNMFILSTAAFIIMYVIYYGFIMSEASVYYTLFGRPMAKQIWGIINLFIYMTPMIILVFTLNDSEKGFCGSLLLKVILLTSALNIIMLIIDPSLAKLEASNNIFVSGYSWAYAIPILIPSMISLFGKTRGFKKLYITLAIILILYSQLQASFFIAIAASVLAFILPLIFRINNVFIRWAIVIALISLLIYSYMSGVLADFLIWLSQYFESDFLSNRCIELAEYIRDPQKTDVGLTTYRFELYHESITTWLKHPLVGNLVYDHIGKNSFADHSTILDLLACGGVLLFAPFCWFLKKMYDTVKSYAHDNKSARYIQVSFIVYIFIAVFNPTLGSFYVLGALMFISPLIMSADI